MCKHCNWPPLTDGFAGPFPLAVAQTHTLQHEAPRLMGSPPGVPDLVGGAALMTPIWWETDTNPMNRMCVCVCVSMVCVYVCVCEECFHGENH